MININLLKKRSLYIIGSFVALVASYVIAENTNSTHTHNSVSGISIPEVFADVPVGGSAFTGGDDSGDGN